MSQIAYKTCYAISYGVVFPSVLIAQSVPHDNAFVHGLIDGAHAAKDMAAEMKNKAVDGGIQAVSTRILEERRRPRMFRRDRPGPNSRPPPLTQAPLVWGDLHRAMHRTSPMPTRRWQLATYPKMTGSPQRRAGRRALLDQPSGPIMDFAVSFPAKE